MMCYVIQFKLMIVARKEILSVQIRPNLKDLLRSYAESKRWSMSQSAEFLIEQALSNWLDEQTSASPPEKEKKTTD